MNRFVKNKKGITLIALVVTIIILIILTGVTLLLTIGDEGVITRAMNAKIEHDKSVYEEFIMIEVAAEEIAGTKETDIYLKNIQNRLEEKREFEGSNYEIKNGNTLAIKTKEGYKYAVIKGKVIRVEEDSSDKELPVIREGELLCKTTPSYWVNTDVIVEITSPKHPLWSIECSEDTVNWSGYNGKITVKENKSIYVKLKNDIGISETYATHTINNIDKTPPQLTAESFKMIDGSLSTRGFQLELQAQDTASGLAQITWNYKLKSDKSWKKSITDVYHGLHTKDSGSKELETKSHTFDKLSKGTYVVQANIYDVAGNVTITPELTIPVGDINDRVEEAGVGSAISYPTGWTNTDVTVTLPKVADIDTIYTIDGTIPTITGTKYEAPFTVSSNCSVQYIFTDGYNITSAKATEVMNIDKDLPTIVSGLAEDNRKITSISTTIIVEDNLSGLGQIEWYYKSETDTEWRKETDIYRELHSATAGDKTVETKTHTFNNLEPNTKYLFYAIIFDVAGNAVQSSSESNPLELETYNLVQFSPNGNADWKKEHSTIVTIEDLADRVVSAKYVWTNSVSEPADSAFVESVANGDTMSHNGVSGTYYLWVFAETESGERLKLRSEGFNLDNAGPTINTFDYTAVNYSSFNLNMTATDNQSGIVEYEIFVAGTSQGKTALSEASPSVTKEISITNAAYGNNACYVIVTDRLGNTSRKDITAKTLMDTTGPNITAFTATKSSATAIALSATANDTGIGLVKFEFYVDNVLKSTQTCTATTASVTKSYTATGLSTGSHSCKVIVYDVANNSSTKTVTGATKLYTWEKWNTTSTSIYKRDSGYTTETWIKSSGSWTVYTSVSFSNTSGFSGSGNNQSMYYGGWGQYASWRNMRYACISATSYYYLSSVGNYSGGYNYVMNKYTCSRKTIYSKGTTKYSDVTSTSSTAYPNGGASGSYWYVYKGVY